MAATARASAEVRVATNEALGATDVVSPIHRGIGRGTDLHYWRHQMAAKKGARKGGKKAAKKGAKRGAKRGGAKKSGRKAAKRRR